MLPLLLVLDGFQADHCVVMQQGHHAVRVVDHVTISVIGRESDSLIWLGRYLVPLCHQLLQNLLVSSGRPIIFKISINYSEQ